MNEASDLFREEAVAAHARWLSLLGSPRIAPLVSRRLWAALAALVLFGMVDVGAIALLAGRVQLTGALAPVGDHARVVQAPARSGRVTAVRVVAGQHVGRGGALLVLDDAQAEVLPVQAPARGILVALNAAVGAAPAPGQALATIEADDADLEARFGASREVAARLKPGLRLTLRIGFGGEESAVDGVVDRLWHPPANAGEDADPVQVAVKLAQRPADTVGVAPDLLAGLRVQAKLPLQLPAWLRALGIAEAT